MYTTHNKDEIYFLFNHNTGAYSRIGDKKTLIKYVTNHLANHMTNDQWKALYKQHSNIFISKVLNQPRMHTFGWSSRSGNVFTNQNLTGKDCYKTYQTTTELYYDEINRNAPDERPSFHESCTKLYTEHLYPHTFYTENGAIFDIRLLIDDVRKCLLNKEYKYKYSYSWIYRRRRKHITYSWPKRLCIREYKTQISCEEQGVHYRKKALPHGSTMNVWDESPSRRSNGWKDKKFKKQWEHGLVNKKIKQPFGRHQFKNTEYDQEQVLLEFYDFMEGILGAPPIGFEDGLSAIDQYFIA